MYRGVIVACIALLLCVGVSLWYLNTPPVNEQAEVYFVIQEGETLIDVAARLRDRNLIRSALLTRALAQMSSRDTLVQSGSYSIPTDMSAWELIVFLTTGQQLLVKAVIPEGLTIRKIAAILQEGGVVVDAAEFIALARDPAVAAAHGLPGDTLEGYLFPDTYYFNHNHRAEGVIEQMISGFRANIARDFPQLAEVDSEELHRVITMASMIEKEYLTAEEAPLIASVLYNRLERGQRLEACSTIVYVITEIEGRAHPSRLYFADLERDSPYNTYRHPGLPPGPIANPGSVAIDAALNPAESDYLYFVLEAEDSTEHRFSRTFAEHTEARIIYLRSRN